MTTATHHAPEPTIAHNLRMDVRREHAQFICNAAGASHEELLAAEWLLTDRAGAYSMGTALGASARRYHALLVSSLRPPVERIVSLASVVDELTTNPGAHIEQHAPLSSHRFPGDTTHPCGADFLTRFEKDHAVRWVYTLHDGVEVIRELALLPDGAGAILTWFITTNGAPAQLTVRPLVALRDFHSLCTDEHIAHLNVTPAPNAAPAVRITRDDLALDLTADAGAFTYNRETWRNFLYERDRERGQDHTESLLAPGSFLFNIPPGLQGARFSIHARLQRAASESNQTPNVPIPIPTRDHALTQQQLRLTNTLNQITAANPNLASLPELPALADAADAFVTTRLIDSKPSTTILAGYPWFADWGRDTMIALPGLLLTTGRYAEARQTLETFARAVRRGLVPNRFDDYGGEPHYNSLDASLWFISAACQYLNVTNDRAGFEQTLKPACYEIIDWFRAGTDFNIHMDERDGLIAAGAPDTQLTWMDAKNSGVVFTPRHGKAVEINALWRHDLCALAQAVATTDPRRSSNLAALAEKVATSFRAAFWNDEGNCLFDCLYPDGDSWRPSAQIRPNQIFAVSLPHSALTPNQQRAVVNTVRDHLLTPFGLRTLAPTDPDFHPRYEGNMFDRDRAYHNGTAWPWLMGPFIEASLRAESFSPESRAEAMRTLQPLLNSLNTECVGQIAEVYDATDAPNSPQRAAGCPAQAWSVAELLRTVALIHS